MKRGAFLGLTPLLLSLPLVGCGGKTIEDEPFVAQSATAFYGFIGGWHATLVDSTSGHVTRTMKIDVTDLDGTYGVEGGAAKVTLSASGSASLVGVSGSVSFKSIDARPPRGSWGTVMIHVDVILVDSASQAHEVHLVGDYPAEVTAVG
jgi:hypothetical protein